MSDVSLSVCSIVDYRFIGQWYRTKADGWIARESVRRLMKRRTHRSSSVDPAWSLVVADLRYLYAYSHVYCIIMDFVSQSDLLLIPYLLSDSTSAHTWRRIRAVRESRHEAASGMFVVGQ